MSQLTPLNPILAENTHRLQWGGLAGSSLSLAITSTATRLTTPVVVVTADTLTASRLEQAFAFFAPECPKLSFPDWETLPYDNFSPHQDIISQRLLTLYSLPHLKQGILIVPINTLMQQIAPREYIESHSFILKKGELLDLESTRKRLVEHGYRSVSQVMEHGEFSVRGSIIDLFPMGSPTPYRVDLFDNEVDSIRTFVPETQRSLETVSEICLLPAHEFPLTEAAITQFRQNWRTRFSGNPTQCPIYQDISQGLSSPGIEYYLPLFFNLTQTLFDYLPKETLFFGVGDLNAAANAFWTEIKERYEQRSHDVTRPLLPPQELFLPTDELFQKIAQFSFVSLHTEKLTERAHHFNFATLITPDVSLENKSEEPLAKLKAFLAKTKSRVLFCAETPGRREALLDLLKNHDIYPSHSSSWAEFLQSNESVNITIAPLEEGLQLIDPPITLITEPQLFGQQILQRRRRKATEQDSDAIIRNLAELHINEPVVHIEHGIGRYAGLQILRLGEIEAEFLMLEYADNDKLYVPVASLHLITRYTGASPEQAPLHRLGSEQWQKAKRKATEQIRDVAAELLEVHARRAARKGYAFKNPDNQYLTFSAAFPFEETPDQQRAILQVVEDMVSEKPMDRLICGDVGFGKTEVAMRAAFIAVQEGRQVAILVPTTLLAQQHYQNFTDRFADWPVRIEVISRFRSASEQEKVIEDLREGKIDILIGTHKLLQTNIQFTRLGLLIIDEEHRFGVRQKERLKTLRSEVDILTLTATPIPRTLNMALASMRDLSIIATPPARRLSIKTFVREHNSSLIREAVLREITRGGQVYYLHNAVESIESAARELQTLIPEARIAIAHGQMRERELERVMADFYHHHSNLLLCTTIIETGIDVPTANTIIITRADKLGLAQLHQLRGRVGRSHHQAYAYLLTPPIKTITSDAEKRLDAIASLEDLGAGFTLATHDLEIRGAGELLGENQSGNMHAIGFSLYMELLERAVNSLKSGKQPEFELSLQQGTEIDLKLSALIPESYIPDVHTRLTLYKRIANARNQNALDELQVELIDRFGLLPIATKNLFRITELKLIAEPLGIRKIDVGPSGGRIEFTAKPNVDPLTLVKLIQNPSGTYKLDGPERLKFFWQCDTADQRILGTHDLLEKLSETSQSV